MNVVPEGTWKGHAIRKARKAGRCQYQRGGSKGQCPATINVGDYYVAGEANWEAGGFGQDRYCMECAGSEARGAVKS